MPPVSYSFPQFLQQQKPQLMPSNTITFDPTPVLAILSCHCGFWGTAVPYSHRLSAAPFM